MEGNYGVYIGNEQIGKVQVLGEGLYWVFHCRCKLTGSVMCRLEVKCGEKRENLGVLVPMDAGFGLDTRLAKKRLKEGTPEFRVIPKGERSGGIFAPIVPEEPFAYIERLKDGFLARQDGTVGLMFTEKS